MSVLATLIGVFGANVSYKAGVGFLVFSLFWIAFMKISTRISLIISSLLFVSVSFFVAQLVVCEEIAASIDASNTVSPLRMKAYHSLAKLGSSWCSS